jgi:hypothetical protein
MLAAQGHEPLAGQEEQPEKRRHPGISQILRQTPEYIEKSLLDDVCRIDLTLHPPFQAQAHHSPQALSMPAEELRKRLPIAGLGLPNQRHIAAIYGGQGSAPKRSIVARGRPSTMITATITAGHTRPSPDFGTP